MAPATPSAQFPNTPWTCVRKAQDPNHPDFIASMNRLMTAYWKPVFHYLRAKGRPAPDAEDLTQAFFLRFLAKGWLQRAGAKPGRFRDYLRTLVKRFAHDTTVRGPAQAKFEGQFVVIGTLMGDDDRAYEPPAHETPEEAFDKQWKADVLAAVRRSLQAYYGGDERRFRLFAAVHFAERLEDRPTQDALAAMFGVSRDWVRAALKEVGERYRRFLRQEIRDQVGSEAEIDDELRGLL